MKVEEYGSIEVEEYQKYNNIGSQRHTSVWERWKCLERKPCCGFNICPWRKISAPDRIYKICRQNINKDLKTKFAEEYKFCKSNLL